MLPTQTPSSGATPAVDPAPVSAADRVSQLVYLVFGLLEAVLGIRVILKLLAADPTAGFTHLIYSLTAPFAASDRPSAVCTRPQQVGREFSPQFFTQLQRPSRAMDDGHFGFGIVKV